VLSEVGVRQPQQEARELVESTYNLRADVLRELLRRCTSIKTVRLCLQLGREKSLPWVAKLNPARLPTGSDRPWVSRSADGVLVLKP
jgi:Transcriptional regulator, AbiEi antitoxin, Type IV TA system